MGDDRCDPGEYTEERGVLSEEDHTAWQLNSNTTVRQPKDEAVEEYGVMTGQACLSDSHHTSLLAKIIARGAMPPTVL
jgi:hypothetical protein